MTGDRKPKWRPTLSMIVAGLLVFILLLPLGGVIFFRLYENHLIRSTEAELIAQSAAIAATVAARLREDGVEALPLGAAVTSHPALDGEWQPVEPQLDLATAPTLTERPDARKTASLILPAYQRVGAFIEPVLVETQRTTLAGFRLLDFNGTVIAGRDEVGLSLAHIPEIEAALAGTYASALRTRIVNNPQPIYSISRGTAVRIFTAMPIVVENRVAGVVYASRTPSNILKELYNQRRKVLVMLGFVLAVTFVIGLVFSRAISGPIRELTERTKKIGSGERQSVKPLAIHGSRELYELSEGMLDMSEKLFERNDYINTFARHVSHELKTPLTSIRGAVELLADNDDTMTPAERHKFFVNILADTERATRLLEKLRALARAENIETAGACDLAAVLAEIGEKAGTLEIRLDKTVTLPLSPESAAIVLENLLDNAARHGARVVTVTTDETANGMAITVADDGSGVSPGNAEKIFDLFFTTRRDSGGTGMGLGIVRAVLAASGGDIALVPGDGGARFRLRLRRRPSA